MDRDLNSLARLIINRLRFGSPRNLYRKREELAAWFIRGSGIEIGALNHPLDVPASVKVQYVDHLSTSGLISHYPELDGDSIVQVDIVDAGEFLESIPDSSQDFVIANHLLEHCQDPIGTLGNWLRVLRIGGIVFLCVPDKRYTFDRNRPVTKLEHIIRDWLEGPEWSQKQHYEEWARLVDRASEEQISQRATTLSQSKISIHFHVWTMVEFRELLEYCRNNLPYDFVICRFKRNGIENIAILKRL